MVTTKSWKQMVTINKKISFDVRELSGKPAGVGRIISSLIKAMQAIDPQREFILIGDTPVGPSGINGKYIYIKSSGMLWHINCARIIKENPQWGTYISVRSPFVPIMVPERSIYFVNDLISFKYPECFPLKTKLIEAIFIKLAVKKVENIVAISYATANDLEAIFPGTNKRTKVIHLAADTIFRKQAKSTKALEKLGIDKPYVLNVGTIEPRKNQLTLLKAFNTLPEPIRDEYSLVIAGKRGFKHKTIYQEIEKATLVGNVKYLEFVSDDQLVQLYNGASLFVYPSLYEGFGLPVIEAMSCGLPVITSNISSLPEVGGAAAIYIDPGDCEGIRNSIVRVLTDKAMRSAMESASVEQSKKYTWETAAKEIYKLT